MLKILIVDDEAPARNRLRRMLMQFPKIQIVGEAGSGHEALALIASTTPDVLLLDISMPAMDGMALARKLQAQGTTPAIVFCTAWSDQALQAFECNAVDYLVKPVRADRLEVALDKARRYISSASASDPHYLRSTLGGKVKLIPLSEVICLHAEDKYTTLVHKTGALIIDQSLQELENEHAGIFVRIHRSTLVAINCIRGLEKTPDGRNLLLLEGCEDLQQVSRRNLPAIRNLIRELI